MLTVSFPFGLGDLQQQFESQFDSHVNSKCPHSSEVPSD